MTYNLRLEYSAQFSSGWHMTHQNIDIERDNLKVHVSWRMRNIIVITSCPSSDVHLSSAERMMTALVSE